MLLSRALNRGYAAGRARWPMEFGLLNTQVLFTELAPWASLVQRFGRCARYPGQSGIWRRDYRKGWEEIDEENTETIYPGQVFLLTSREVAALRSLNRLSQRGGVRTY